LPYDKAPGAWARNLVEEIRMKELIGNEKNTIIVS